MQDNEKEKEKPPREAHDAQEQNEEKLPPIVRKVPDPPVPNRAHTEM